MNPAMIAVINPFSGDTPEEIPNAMDRGSAIIATINQRLNLLKIVLLKIRSLYHLKEKLILVCTLKYINSL